jgi:hypothetical protein
MTNPLNKQINDVLSQIEATADEIRVQVHLAGLDVGDIWNKKLEPRLLDARKHACDAKEASKAALESTLQALRDFQKTL